MYKLSNYVFIASALAVCLFAGCTSDDVGVNQSGKALTLNGGILENVEPVTMNSRGIMLTTAPQNPDSIIESEYTLSAETRTPVNDNNWAGIDGNRDIAVQIGDGNAPYKYSVDAAGKLTSENPYYFTTTNNVTVKSWYPYTSTALSASGFTVQSDQSSITNLQKSDLLFGTSTTANHALSNAINYSHKTARVIVKVVVDKINYRLDRGVINSVKFTGAKLTGAVTTDGELTGSGSNTSTPVTMYQLSNTSANNVITAYYVAQIPPQSAQLAFSLDIGNTPYTAVMSAARDLAAGIAYELTINVTSAKVFISSGNSVDVGDYYCNSADGQAWVVKRTDLATMKSTYGIKPIALVFSNTTSARDQSYGWNYGYALSFLTKTINWSSELNDTPIPNFGTTDLNWLTYYGGYYNSKIIYDLPDFSSTTYPAFYYTKNLGTGVWGGSNYAAPSCSSGWYIPSAGQLYKELTTLGGLSASGFSVMATTDLYFYNYSGTVESLTNVHAAAMNSYFIPITDLWGVDYVSSYGYGDNDQYWSSSEINAKAAVVLDCWSGHGIGFVGNEFYNKTTIFPPKGGTGPTDCQWKVRPVIAF